jgi:aspartate/methionine/tyrosine aminotransferase
MKYKRMPIEIESPEQLGYGSIECNLAESSVNDAIFKDLKLDLNDLILCYGSHAGKTELRDLIASEHAGISGNDILITTGAASALFIVATSLLEKEDHLIVVRPNYASNIETPRAIGCEIDYVDLKFEDKFALDPDLIARLIKKNTKLISITTPHNPTGVIISTDTILKVIGLAEKNNCYLLVDETYRDLSFERPNEMAASLSKNVISVSSVSKAFGLPGIRIGWIITKNEKLQELFLGAKEQIFLCNSVIDEEVAFQFINQKKHFLPAIREKILNHFKITEKWIANNPSLEWIKPQGGVICFPRFKANKKIDFEMFHQLLFEKHKTLVGPGHWFEMDPRYMRIGFGWPSTMELEKGLNNITLTINQLQQ